MFQAERMLALLEVFESGPLAGLDLKQNYMLLLQRYSRELELLRKTYQRQRESPPIGRNLPPVLMIHCSIKSVRKRGVTYCNPSYINTGGALYWTLWVLLSIMLCMLSPTEFT